MIKPLVTIAFVFLLGLGARGAEDPLATVGPTHPRVLAHANTWPELASRARSDSQLAAVLAAVTRDAEALLSVKPVTYRKNGRRLLAVSQTVRGRVLTLAFAYRLNGQSALARRAIKEMLAAANFADWNPSHFLDTAEMTAALGIGYDWLYDEMTTAERLTILEAIVAKGLRLGVGKDLKGWKHWENNWNQVCYGGLTLGALAVATEEPALAGELLRQARADIGNGLKPYAPDGIYPEGPGYWGYGTSYQVLMIAALETALGTDWDLPQRRGFRESARVRVLQTGPTGQWFNFADCGPRAGLEPALFWFAQREREPALLNFQAPLLAEAVAGAGRKVTEKNLSLLPLVALWWSSAPTNTAGALPLAWAGAGENPVAIFRSSWTDTNALYLALKGGTAAANHAHMDAGSFVLEADGFRWAEDLGLQSYQSLEAQGIALFQRAQDSPRWSVFRLNNFSHNTLTIAGQLHRMKGFAPITNFTAAANSAGSATVDLSEVFAGQATNVMRTFRFDAGRSQVVIADQLAGLKPGAEVRWAMVTRAKVKTTLDGAILRQGGRELRVRLQSPAAAKFRVEKADPPNRFDAPNPDYSVLVLKTNAGTNGGVTITVVFERGS